MFPSPYTALTVTSYMPGFDSRSAPTSAYQSRDDCQKRSWRPKAWPSTDVSDVEPVTVNRTTPPGCRGREDTDTDRLVPVACRATGTATTHTATDRISAACRMLRDLFGS